MAAKIVTEENYEQEVLQEEKTVLVDFWADWCGPCKMLLPVIEELAEEVKDTKICKINVDEQPGLAERYGIMTIPTLAVIKNGKTVNRVSGVRSKEDILNMLNG